MCASCVNTLPTPTVCAQSVSERNETEEVFARFFLDMHAYRHAQPFVIRAQSHAYETCETHAGRDADPVQPTHHPKNGMFALPGCFNVRADT